MARIKEIKNHTLGHLSLVSLLYTSAKRIQARTDSNIYYRLAQTKQAKGNRQGKVLKLLISGSAFVSACDAGD
jgi:hypothetical protein